MCKKKSLIIALQAVVISAFIMIAAGSVESLSSKEAYDAGYESGHGIGTIINNWFVSGESCTTFPYIFSKKLYEKNRNVYFHYATVFYTGWM